MSPETFANRGAGTPLLVIFALALPAQAELGDEGPVPIDVVAPQVVEQATTSTDEHEQPTARVMVLLVDLQVLREVVDPLGEDRHLNLG